MNKIIIASGPVIVEDGKVLLNEHGDTSFYKFCGGKPKDENESLIDVARREVKEEMGIEIEILDEVPFLMHTRKDKETDVILAHFLAKRIGEVKPADDIRKWNWLEIDSLEDRDLAPNIIPVLKHFKFI